MSVSLISFRKGVCSWHLFHSPQDAVSALLARTSAELLAVEQELAQEDDEEAGPGEELRGPEGDW